MNATNMSYLRKFQASMVDPSERWLVAGNLLGQLALIDLERFAIVREMQVHGGTVEAVAFHQTLPYAASVSSEHTVCLFRFEPDGRWEHLQTIQLRAFATENADFHYRAIVSQSSALWFHPTERKLLTRNAWGAVLELRFDDTRVESTFCRNYFVRADGNVDETTYVRYLHGSGWVFCSGANGNGAVVDPVRPEQPLSRFRIGDEAIHQAAHVGGDRYLLASDTRRVILFDGSLQTEPVFGPAVTRDHLEQVAYCKRTGRAFVSSFDRNIYEIDPHSGAKLGIAVCTPFKCRWLQVLEREPDILIIQCRNGALYRANLRTRRIEGILKETPNAFWCAVQLGSHEIAIAGESAEVLHLLAEPTDVRLAEVSHRAEWRSLDAEPGAYTKRLVTLPEEGGLVHARSDGTLVLETGAQSRVVARLDSPLRDVVTRASGTLIYACCEDGSLHVIDGLSGARHASWQSPDGEPLWALAYNAARDAVAVFERMGSMYLLAGDDLRLLGRMEGIGRAKRARWVSDDRLLVSVGAHACLVDVRAREVVDVMRDHDNTIEDFDWDESRRFVAAITYDKELALYDYQSMEFIHRISIDMDYPHGVLWLHPARGEGAYPYELIAFGRSGLAQRFRVHDERLVYMDALNTPSAPVHDRGLSVG